MRKTTFNFPPPVSRKYTETQRNSKPPRFCVCVVKIIAVLLVVFFPMVGIAVETLEELQITLSKHAVIRGSFEQVRTLEMFSNPLRSNGRFLLSKELGLQWKQTEPFPVSLVLGTEHLSQQFGNQPAKVMKAEENPMMFHFSKLFLSIFKGETEGLEDQFDIKFTPGDDWALKLVPRSEPLKAAFKTIEIKGSGFLNYIRLEETSGDVSLIQFTDQHHEPETLSEAERKAFEV